MFCERNSVGERAATFRDVKRLEPINYPFIEKGQHSSKTVVVNRGQKKNVHGYVSEVGLVGSPRTLTLSTLLLFYNNLSFLVSRCWKF